MRHFQLLLPSAQQGASSFPCRYDFAEHSRVISEREEGIITRLQGGWC